VTSQPQPAPGEASQYLRPLRDIAAYALVAAVAVMLFVAIIRLIPSGVGLDFGSRAQDSFYSYVNVPTIFFPLGAVLLSLFVQPRHPQAKLVTVIAMVEYGVATVFGIVFGILVGLIKIAGFSVRTAFEELLIRAAWLAVFAVAAFATYQIWHNLFYTPQPKPQPGVYGQPRYGVPGTYPGQPGYGPPAPGQPGFGQPGQQGFGQPPFGPPAPGQPGQPSQPGQPGGQPGQPGQSAHAAAPGQDKPGFGQAGFGQPGFGQPVSGAPGGYDPAPGQAPSPYPPGPDHVTYSSPAAPAYPSTAGPADPPAPSAFTERPAYSAFTEPTQAVPQHEPAATTPDRQPGEAGDERTQIVRNDRPDYGPADQDPPRR
jgi:hypothetical protein